MNVRTFIKVDKAAFYRFIATEPEGRYEYEWGRIVQQQQGGTRRHFDIAGNFTEAMKRQLSRKTWAVLEGRGVETAETIRSPDVVVEPANESPDCISTARPAVVVEVLSPSSTDRDLFVKPAEYLSLASLDAYIVASQTDANCIVWLRGPDGSFADEPITLAGLNTAIVVATLSLRIEMTEIYGDLLSA
jgi:Uma2 family endonuclease